MFQSFHWDGVLQPASYWTTNTFNIMVHRRLRRVDFAIVLALGIGGAIMKPKRPEPPVRTGEAMLQDLNAHGKEPTWYSFVLNPLL